jgi:ADP-ribosyl-[dinitrogen reductase] hydrolase
MEKNLNNKIKGSLFGLAVGDALGVPVEFKQREYLKAFPIKGITGYGSWNQPPGTWSDDSSLAFCLAESLSKGYNLDDIAKNFVDWMCNGYWGAHHKVFDIGNATHYAIGRLTKGTSPLLSGGMMEDDNGNGSLMRIMPLIFHIKGFPVNERYQKIKEVSSITHAHFRSVFACFIYLEFALQIFNGNTINVAYNNMQQSVKSFAAENDFNPKEILLFSRILDADIRTVKEDKIHSGGYVLQTLEASLWCLLNTDNYADAVLKAVNLGGDTDTTACITGGLAGLLYGYDEILQVWINEIVRKDDIEDLCNRLYKNMQE